MANSTKYIGKHDRNKELFESIEEPLFSMMCISVIHSIALDCLKRGDIQFFQVLKKLVEVVVVILTLRKQRYKGFHLCPASRERSYF